MHALVFRGDYLGTYHLDRIEAARSSTQSSEVLEQTIFNQREKDTQIIL